MWNFCRYHPYILLPSFLQSMYLFRNNCLQVYYPCVYFIYIENIFYTWHLDVAWACSLHVLLHHKQLPTLGSLAMFSHSDALTQSHWRHLLIQVSAEYSRSWMRPHLHWWQSIQQASLKLRQLGPDGEVWVCTWIWLDYSQSLWDFLF